MELGGTRMVARNCGVPRAHNQLRCDIGDDGNTPLSTGSIERVIYGVVGAVDGHPLSKARHDLLGSLD